MVNNWRPQDAKSKESMKEYDTQRRLKDPVGSLLRNELKRDGTLEEFEKLISYMKDV